MTRWTYEEVRALYKRAEAAEAEADHLRSSMDEMCEWASDSVVDRCRVALAPNARSAKITELQKLRRVLAAVRNGWTHGQPSSMNLVIAQVEEIMSEEGKNSD